MDHELRQPGINAHNSPTHLSKTKNNLSCLLYAAGDARFEERPIPTLDSPYDVLVRIAFTGVCGSDVHFWLNGGVNSKIQPGNPLIMGHEAAGTIEKIGTAVRNLQPGDRVAIEPGYPCGRCADCKQGHYNFCPDMRFAASPGPGYATHGTLTKFFRSQAEFCYKLPDHVAMDAAVLVEPLAVAVHSAKLANIRPGQKVVVFGCGTVGLLCCAVAREFGAVSIIAVDIKDERLKFASSFAATGTYKSDITLTSSENVKRIIASHDLGHGADAVIEASGAELSIQTGIEVLRRGGNYVQTGLGRPVVAFPIVEMSERELNVRGCFRYGPGDFELALGFLSRGNINVESLITEVVEFERAPDAWEIMRSGQGIKTLIRVGH